MTNNQKPMTATEFWQIKHKIDDEVARLGWSVDYCKRYIEFHYGCRSRLVMTDTQIVHLYKTLMNWSRKPWRDHLKDTSLTIKVSGIVANSSALMWAGRRLGLCHST